MASAVSSMRFNLISEAYMDDLPPLSQTRLDAYDYN